jgi:RimJ/RimL family protein N-acetyltransferase
LRFDSGVLELAGIRVTLRPIRPDECERVIDARLKRPGNGGPVDLEALREWLEHSGDWFEGRLDLAVETEGRFVGTIQARAPLRFSPPGVCELGIELFDGESGKGVGTDAVQLLTDWLLENGFPRVQATTDVRNVAMRRVLEKLGFELEGVLRAFMPDGDGRADYTLYAITR